MKKLWIAVAVVLLLCLSGCSIATEFVRETLGDEAADEYERQMQQELDKLEEAGQELNEIIKDEIDKEVESVKDEIRDQVDEGLQDAKDQVDDFLDEVLPDGVDPEQLLREWEALVNLPAGTVKDENGFTEPYQNVYSRGQCTWYALGRFEEDTGIDLQMSYYGSAKTWLDNCNDDRVEVVRDPYDIRPHSVAVDYKTSNTGHAGHVTYVEYVTYDENGNPVDVYFTECNWDTNGQYDAGVDGIVKKKPFKDFINRGDHKVIGYLRSK